MEFANVEEQYRKNPDLKKADVDKLQDWMSKQPHLPKISELEMILFLHSNYYKIEATKTTIDNYYTCRTHVHDFFASRDILGEDMTLVNEMACFVPLSTATSNGYKSIFVKFVDLDPSKFNLSFCLKMFTFASDAWLLEEGAIEGHLIIFDMAGVQMGHMLRLSVMPIKHYLYYLQEAMPVRLKGLHFVNTPPFMDKILALMKPFMKKELWEVFHMHSNIESLFKFLPPEVLPKEYPGGKDEPVKSLKDKNYEHLKGMRQFFLDEEKNQRVNEKLRQGKPKDIDQIFGMAGNFRKLDID